MNSNNNILGENIKRFRIIKGLSRKEMAKSLNTTYRTVSSWETGEKKPRYKKLEQIAELLNIDSAALLQTKIQDEDILKSINEDPFEKLAKQLHEAYMSVPDQYKPIIENELLKHANNLKNKLNNKG
ncbi:helix-turn-helix domain-containing protein [Bacillus cereus]